MRVMFRRLTSIAYLVVLFLFLLTETFAAAATRERKPQTARITSIKVSTVNPTFEGGFEALHDIFEGKTGNQPVFAGSGSANYPTHYLLVLVESTGQNWGPDIELTGREGRRVVYRKIAKAYVPPGGASSDPVKAYAFFLIEGDRCETIRLTARLLGQRRPSTMTKTIEFGCGE